MKYSRTHKNGKNIQFAVLSFPWKAWSLTLGDEILSRNVDNYQSTPCNIPEEGRAHFRRDGSKKSRIALEFLRAMNQVQR